MIYELKCEQQYFEAVASGKKTFEVRKNDRHFAVGDCLALNEIIISDSSTTLGTASIPEIKYTGRSCLVEVAYILDDKANRFLQPGFVVMAIRPCDITTATEYLQKNYNRNMYEVPVYGTNNTKEATV